MTNTNQAIFNDPRAKRWGNILKVAALLVGCFFIAPFIWVALGGLLGLIVAAIVVTVTWMSRGWFYAVAANLRLKLVKAEARKNPVETLQNDLLNKMTALDERKSAIGLLDGKIRTFSDKVTGLKEKYGVADSGYLKLNNDLNNLQRVLADRRTKWKAAAKELDRYKEVIERAQWIWDAAQAAQAANEASGLTEDDFFAKLRSETALDSVQDSYNQALASLDTSMLDEQVPTTK